MPAHGFFRKDFRRLQMAALAIAASFAFGDVGIGQQVPRQVAPVPQGTPDLVVGPPGNPYGPAPMPIGPVQGPPNRGPRFGRPSAFTPYPMYQPYPQYPTYSAYPGYPPAPYIARRATPFDAMSPPVLAPPNLSNIPLSPPPGAAAPFLTPAPIGNLRLTVSETFLNRLIARDEQKPGEIRDFILGAQVSGRQTTETKLRFDLLPSADKLRGMLVLNGVTDSQTTGVTQQAMVDVASQQQFLATKEIFFDGLKFSTRHAVVSVRAKNQTLGATTALSGTLFGGIANRIAYREAERRKPAAEAVARDRVAERVYPEFDNEIDRQLGLANDQLDGPARRMLQAANLAPAAQQVFSTDTHLVYSVVIGADSPMSATAPLENRVGDDSGVNLLIHESLLNGLVGMAGLKGLKTTDKEVKALLAPYEVKPGVDELENAAPPIALPGMENIVTSIEFDDVDPLTIRIELDRTLVTMRAKFKPAGQDVLPQLAVTIEYKTELVGEKLVVVPGNVKVVSAKDNGDSAPPGVAMKLISQAIEASLTKLAIDRTVPNSLWSFGGAAPRVVGIRSQDGWAAVSID